MEPLLLVRNLRTTFPVYGGLLSREIGRVKAVDGVSLRIDRGHTLGLVGESGCGKTTLGRSILRLLEPDEGELLVEGKNILSMGKGELRSMRRNLQIIFQDPYASLNPRMTAGAIVGEGMKIHGIATGKSLRERVVKLFELVGLPPDALGRYPHEFSGGQRQRIGIARALSLTPSLIVADEPVSALDVSIQAQIINLLLDLQDKFGLSYLFISHDLRIVRHISDHVAVMYLGKIIEEASREELYSHPSHPYTQALLSAVPVPDPARRKKKSSLSGDVPSPMNPPPGCSFHPRCPHMENRCKEEFPLHREIAPGHKAACHFAERFVQ